MSRLIIIDGHAILHRAFHAMPPLTTKEGILVNAVYGFVAMMLKIIEDFQPTNLIVCFDRPKPTIRKQMYVGYQAKRPKMAEDLSGQISIIHELLNYMGISIYEMDGYEADDVMGTIVQKVETERKKGRKEESSIDEVMIVTGDRDILQLVTGSVKVCMPLMGLTTVKVYGEKEVEEKFGIKSSQIVDYKALVGDQSDNYPGVPGIGPKTASDLLKKFGTLENVYNNLSEIENERVKKLLSENTESAALSKKLATIIREVPIEIKLKKSELKPLGRPDIISRFEELEFRSLIPRLLGKSSIKRNELKIEVKKEKKEQNDQMQLF